MHGWDWDDASLVALPNIAICGKCGIAREISRDTIERL